MSHKGEEKETTLEQLLEFAAKDMATNLRRRLLAHSGELGTAREQIIREFLGTYLPKRFEVSTGFAFDCTGRMSKQLDIVIFDSQVCPRFEAPGGKFLFPCEAILAVGQVKSSLTSRQKFRGVLDNLSSVKVLDRSANGAAYDTRFNETLCPSENHLHQIFTFLFVTGEAMNPQTLGLTLLEDAFAMPVEYLPNVILALNRYLITYCCDNGVCPNVMDARGVAIQSTENPSDALLRFYLLLGQALNVIRTSALPYWEYLSRYHNIPATVLQSSVETPPPHRGKWTEGAQ
ncbi:MAG: DUF6602 domain-containing protein [Verrucomicrobiota bacterium]|jgi:hypothetical protein